MSPSTNSAAQGEGAEPTDGAGSFIRALFAFDDRPSRLFTIVGFATTAMQLVPMLAFLLLTLGVEIADLFGSDGGIDPRVAVMPSWLLVALSIVTLACWWILVARVRTLTDLARLSRVSGFLGLGSGLWLFAPAVMWRQRNGIVPYFDGETYFGDELLFLPVGVALFVWGLVIQNRRLQREYAEAELAGRLP